MRPQLEVIDCSAMQEPEQLVESDKRSLYETDGQAHGYLPLEMLWDHFVRRQRLAGGHSYLDVDRRGRVVVSGSVELHDNPLEGRASLLVEVVGNTIHVPITREALMGPGVIVGMHSGADLVRSDGKQYQLAFREH